ncbi:MAG: hypothetical protein A3J50_03195 [Candidatus Woykebacteria bacterium RIFCSPHIGHO2_02_FULL_43_16b]|uniref:Uncharacterized protein n=1 Tax=Candidatus Woykebacteria bacterium RIFCSPHIGHO2_02_FULL_43_16b TaxID=1802601 RepID=A0A1G1WSI6_9BACT|nr:MAG: hypothetical protein A3J50_03195 [Candidatus Woykebacteria bacterium RIFCSPHIGHO2_02_FULL_43_16b]
MSPHDKLDALVEDLPLVGTIFRRNYLYFKKHTLITNLIHGSFGLGLGMLILAADNTWGWVFLWLGILGHVYAFVKTDK